MKVHSFVTMLKLPEILFLFLKDNVWQADHFSGRSNYSSQN